MIELIPFGNIFDKITDWFSSAIQKAKTENEKEATRLLRDIAIVVSGVTAIDNTFRKIILDLEMFSINWNETKREIVAQNILTFASDETIITAIRRSMRSIEEQQPDKKFEFLKVRLLNFIGITKQILEDVGDVGERRFQRVTPFPSRENLIMLVKAVSSGKSDMDANMIKSNTESYHLMINKEKIILLENEFIDLKHLLLQKYPLIDDIGNAVKIFEF